jgi:hypothetical protein
MSNIDFPQRLRPIQLAALVILMSEAREINNKEFFEMAKFTLTGDDRKELETPELIKSRRVGQMLAFELTDRGWVFCKQLHTAEARVDRSRVARSVFVLLDGLGRSLDRLRVSHAEFFKQPADAKPEKPVNVVVDGDLEARIRAAYADLPKSVDGWVGLADLREHLGGLDRSAVDEALRAMVRQDGIRIIPVANAKSLQPRDRAAALRIGDEDNHALWIGPA